MFPCEGKEPLTRRGFKDATTDPQRIHMWWSRYPEANIGVPTGERSRLLVIDLDGAAGRDSWARVSAEMGEAPTLTATTGGGGTHLYYRYPAEEIRNSAGTRLGPGVDVRGEGGYAVVPPSFTEGPYRWSGRREVAEAPPELVEKLAVRPAPTSREGGTSPAEPAAVQGEGFNIPEVIPEGQRNHALFRFGCSLRGRGFDLATIAGELHRVNAERCSSPIPGAEVEKIAASASSYPAGNRRPTPAAEVLEALAVVERRIWEADAEGDFAGSKSRRDVWISLVQLARKHGTLIPAGVRVSVSVRVLAGVAGVAPSTAQLALRALREERRISRDDEGRGTGAGAIVLRVPGGPGGPGKTDEKRPRTESVQSATQTTGGRLDSPARSSVPISCNGSGRGFATFTAPRLRRSSPARKAGKRGTIRYEGHDGREHVRVRESKPRPATPAQKRLGKSRGAIIDHLEAAGPLTYDQLTERLCYARRDYVRRVLVRPLMEAGVVQESTGGLVELSWGWREALGAERERTGEVELGRRYTARHRAERVVYLCRRMVWRRVPHGRIAVKLGLTVEQVREIVRPAVRVSTKAEREEARREEERRRAEEGRALYRTLLRLATAGQRVQTARGPGRVWDVKDDGREVRVVLDADPSRWVPLRPEDLTGELVA